MRKIFLLFILLIPLSIAHLDAGIDEEVGDYIVDLGYSPATLSTETSTLFSFSLKDKESEDTAPITSAWIRITNEDGSTFAGTFEAEFDVVTFTYVFPTEGEYDITVRYYNEDIELVENTFTVNVTKNLPYSWMSFIAILFIVLAIILSHYKKKK